MRRDFYLTWDTHPLALGLFSFKGSFYQYTFILGVSLLKLG